MALPLLENGSPIDHEVINSLITKINSLEKSNNAQTFYNNNHTYVQNSLGDKIVTLGFRLVFTASVSAYYDPDLITVTFPNGVTFSEPPVLSVTFDGTGQYLIPFISSISGTGFKLGALRAANGWVNLNPNFNVNVIAVGPTGMKFAV